MTIVFWSRPGWKITPGERTSWLTTTRSVPLMMKVPRRHHREVPHEDGLLFDLAGGTVHERCPHEDRGGVGDVLGLALVDGELWRWPKVGVGRVEIELQAQLIGEVGDRADIVECLGEAGLRNQSKGCRAERQLSQEAEVPRRCWRTSNAPGCGNVKARVYSHAGADRPGNRAERCVGTRQGTKGGAVT